MVGFDASRTMLERGARDLARSGLGNLALIRGDATSLPFRASSFEAACCFAALHLFSEPFAALDEITRAEMRYLLLELWQRTGNTVVFVTHSITEAVILSDRVVGLAARRGRIAAVETVSLPRPRAEDMEDAEAFHRHVSRVRHELKGGWAR